MNRPYLLSLSLLLIALVVTGCERDEIQTYTVPRSSEEVGSGNTRLLVAIVPTGEDTWFFKLVGRHDIVDLVEPAFQELVRSLKLDGKTLTWKVPVNWKEDRDNPARVATIRPEGVDRLEIAVSKLGGKQPLKPNLDRWRRIDLGLGPISNRLISKVTTEKKVGDLSVTLVDMRGPGVARPAAAKMPKMPDQPAGGNRDKSFDYKKPDSWTDGGSNNIAAAIFNVSRQGKSARVLVTPIPGKMMGGLLENINRWRSEVALPPLSSAQLSKLNLREISVGKQTGKYLDLIGEKERSLVVWLEAEGSTWYFKMRGPKEVVEPEQPNFEAFLKSVSFRK